MLTDVFHARRCPILVLTRRRDEVIRIGHEIEIVVVEIRGDKVRLGVQARKDMPVHRSEVYEEIYNTKGIDDGKCDKG